MTDRLYLVESTKATISGFGVEFPREKIVADFQHLVDLAQPLHFCPQTRSSSRSSLVAPAATPTSISSWATQRRTDSRETPSDSAT
ncbi:hypothetical protein [Streptomyces cinereoruber]|uniref:hypothetical protein n=1 Tax=Streptomyces cinereoruber TaxID=67260 RepID=UPI00362563BC